MGVEAIDVIEFTLQGIAENVVCVRDPLEAFFCMPVTRIDIRMIPTSQLPKSPLYLPPRSRSADLENQIQIFATCHDSAVSLQVDLERCERFRDRRNHPLLLGQGAKRETNRAKPQTMVSVSRSDWTCDPHPARQAAGCRAALSPPGGQGPTPSPSIASPSAATVERNNFSFFFSSASTYSASMTSSVFPAAAAPEPSLAGPRWPPPACEPDLYIASAAL